MPKRKAANPAGTAPQLVVRVSRELDGDLRAAAALDIDVSNLVRMVLAEHLGGYIERGVLARKKLREARQARRPRRRPVGAGRADQR